MAQAAWIRNKLFVPCLPWFLNGPRSQTLQGLTCLLFLTQQCPISGRFLQESNLCTADYCRSPAETGGELNCWAGQIDSPCSCSEGVPQVTGQVRPYHFDIPWTSGRLKMQSKEYEYTCCIHNTSDDNGDYACGDYDSKCSPNYCTSRGKEGFPQCWAGVDHFDPCSCSQGRPKLTGQTFHIGNLIFHEYTCCLQDGSTGLGDYQCGISISLPNCNFEHCTSKGHDCVAGTKVEPCSCSQGIPRETGFTSYNQEHGTHYLVYACCPGNSDEVGDYACGDYLPPLVFAVAGVCCILSGMIFCIASKFLKVQLCAEADDDLSSFPVVDGNSLHRSVPPGNWCVTKEDLKQFGRIVKRQMAEGKIIPTDLDQFDVNDFSIGPSVYTVNEQLIKPVTRAAGNPSWALMLHPDGLTCDIFYTHCWAEGIFEFLSKVLASWPRSAKHAYVCFLSNPQTLDIADLVGTPRQSPFACALKTARFMVAVPNQRSSIYTRIWCAYEAFLAHSWDKVIYVASEPNKGFWTMAFRHFGIGTGFCGIGLIIHAMMEWTAPSDMSNERYESLVMKPGLIGLPILLLLHSFSWKCWTFVKLSAALGGLINAYMCFDLVLDWDTLRADQNTLAVFQRLLQMSVFMTIPVVMESDRRRGLDALHQAKELRSGFTGKVRNAQSSVLSDKEAILAEIAEMGNEDAVDEAVDVLVASGTSTPHVRLAASRVGALQDVDVWPRLPLLLGFVCVIIVGLEKLHPGNVIVGSENPEYCKSPIVVLRLCTFAVWLVIFLLLPRDRKAFAIFSVCCVYPAFLLDSIEFNYAGRVLRCTGDYCICMFSGPLMIACSIPGPAGVARVPIVGPPLVRLFVGQQRSRFWRRPAKPSFGASQDAPDIGSKEQVAEEDALKEQNLESQTSAETPDAGQEQKDRRQVWL